MKVLARLNEIRGRLEAAEQDSAGPWTHQCWPAGESGWDAEMELRCAAGQVVTAMGSEAYMQLLANAAADLEYLLGELVAAQQDLSSDGGRRHGAARPWTGLSRLLRRWRRS